MLERVLQKVLLEGSTGTSVFYSGMQRGTQTLTNAGQADRRRVVLFLSDGPRPTGSDPTGISPDGRFLFAIRE